MSHVTACRSPIAATDPVVIIMTMLPPELFCVACAAHRQVVKAAPRLRYITRVEVTTEDDLAVEVEW